MKKTISITTLIIIVLFYMIYTTNNNNDFEFGAYKSEELIRAGLYSVVVEKDHVEKNSGMEYVLEKNKITLKYIDNSKRSLLPSEINNATFKNINYTKADISDYPEHHTKYLKSVFGDIENGSVYKIYDESNNRIGYDILLLKENVYIYDINLLAVDKIILKK